MKRMTLRVSGDGCPSPGNVVCSICEVDRCASKMLNTDEDRTRSTSGSGEEEHRGDEALIPQRTVPRF